MMRLMVGAAHYLLGHEGFMHTATPKDISIGAVGTATPSDIMRLRRSQIYGTSNDSETSSVGVVPVLGHAVKSSEFGRGKLQRCDVLR